MRPRLDSFPEFKAAEFAIAESNLSAKASPYKIQTVTKQTLWSYRNLYDFELNPKQYFEAVIKILNLTNALALPVSNKDKGNKANVCSVDFSRNNSGGKLGCQLLALLILRNEYIQEINLSENHMGIGFSHLTSSLFYNFHLKSLILKDNQIDAEGAQGLSEWLASSDCTINNLDLYHNLLGNVGFSYISEALKVNKTITHLNLFWNKADDEGFKHIAEALKVNTKLVYLNLGHNASGYVGFTALASALTINSENSSLNTLILNDNSGGVKGFGAFGKLLSINTTLKTLHICRNLAGAKGIMAFCAGFQYNHSLTALTLSGNQGGNKSAIALSRVIKYNLGLVALDVSFNSFGDAGLKVIADALRFNKTLRLLHLGNNQSGDEGIMTLSDYFPYYSLEYLDLRGNFVGKSTYSSINCAYMISATLKQLQMDKSVEDDTADPRGLSLGPLPSTEGKNVPPPMTPHTSRSDRHHAIATPHKNSLTTPKPHFKFMRQPSIIRDRGFLTEQLLQPFADLSSLAYKQTKALLASQIIASELSTNIICSSLSLKNNSLRFEGCENILNGLKTNTALKYLNLDLNQVDKPGIGYILADVLKTNHCLYYVNLNRNHINYEEIERIVETIKEYKHCPNFILDIFAKDYRTKRLLQTIREQNTVVCNTSQEEEEDEENPQSYIYKPAPIKTFLFDYKYGLYIFLLYYLFYPAYYIFFWFSNLAHSFFLSPSVDSNEIPLPHPGNPHIVPSRPGTPTGLRSSPPKPFNPSGKHDEPPNPKDQIKPKRGFQYIFDSIYIDDRSFRLSSKFSFNALVILFVISFILLLFPHLLYLYSSDSFTLLSIIVLILSVFTLFLVLNNNSMNKVLYPSNKHHHHHNIFHYSNIHDVTVLLTSLLFILQQFFLIFYYFHEYYTDGSSLYTASSYILGKYSESAHDYFIIIFAVIIIYYCIYLHLSSLFNHPEMPESIPYVDLFNYFISNTIYIVLLFNLFRSNQVYLFLFYIYYYLSAFVLPFFYNIFSTKGIIHFSISFLMLEKFFIFVCVLFSSSLPHYISTILLAIFSLFMYLYLINNHALCDNGFGYTLKLVTYSLLSFFYITTFSYSIFPLAHDSVIYVTVIGVLLCLLISFYFGYCRIHLEDASIAIDESNEITPNIELSALDFSSNDLLSPAAAVRIMKLNQLSSRQV